MELREALDYQLYVQRENEFFHESYKNELFIYEAVKRGDTELILENQRKYSKNSDAGKGNLSDNPLRNKIYHMIINTALITRICSEAGLPHETAYTLSDMYIRKADKCKSVKEVMNLNDKMVLDFARQMKQFFKKDILSVSVRKTLNYICDNLHRKITVAELAENANLNRSYLSVLFKKEVGNQFKIIFSKKDWKLQKICLYIQNTVFWKFHKLYIFHLKVIFAKGLKKKQDLLQKNIESEILQ